MRGQKDFGAYQTKVAGATLTDLSELAARLGSIVTYDRRGDVIDFDDFEGTTVNWGKIEAEGVATGLLNYELPKRGSQCIKLTTGDTLSAVKGIKKGLSLLRSASLGLEISFAQPNANIFLGLTLYWYDGTNEYRAGLKLSFNDKKLYYLDSSETWQEIASALQFESAAHIYHTVKMVADFEAGKYNRILLANTEYDLSSYAVYSVASETLPHSLVVLGIVNEASTGGSLWLDHYILTQNEP